jgi:hypothetical protein
MPRDDVSKARRVAARLAGPVALLRDIAGARAALRRHGYQRIAVTTWDFGRPFGLGRTEGRRRNLAERLPRHAVVVGYMADPGPTLLDAVAVQADAIVAGSVGGARPSVRSGLLVSVGERGVLRTAVGPARAQIVSQVAALEELLEGPVPELDTQVIPEMLGFGRAGLADWSLEQRLAGSTPSAPLDGKLFGAALDFLLALHACGSRSAVKSSSATSVDAAAALLAPARAEALRAVSHRVAAIVNDLPHGFAHGDFFEGNLLVEGGKLVGVVDWDAAGAGRPPLLDFLHLWHLNRRRVEDVEWGTTIANDLLPWARTGGDDTVRSFAGRIGIEVTPARLEALVAAYWLARLAYQLTRHADRAERRVWVENNVDAVLRELAAGTLS